MAPTTEARTGENTMSTTTQSLEKVWMTTNQIAEYLSVSTRTIANWRESGRIPFLQISRNVIRYNINQVQDALRKL